MPTVNKKSAELKLYHNLLVVTYKFKKLGMYELAAQTRKELDVIYSFMTPNDQQRVYDWYSHYWLDERELKDAGL